jgi:UDP-N-acetylglucosamine 3-dehydrogenase
MRIRRRKLRVGVIGTGAFARACHLPEIASHPHATVVMLCGRDAARTNALAMEFGVAATTLDAAELCASDEVDAVTVCTPNNLHARHALLAVQHGKHVFCEKPLGFTVEEAQAMVDAANQRKLVHQVGFTFRHLFGVEEMRRRVRGGDIGEPQVLRIHHQYFDGLAEGDPVRWQHTLEVAGGGVLRDSGSHLFDLARLMLGPVAALRAEIRSSERPEVDTDDVATARLRYASGAQGNCFASRIMPARQPNFVEVVGSKGTLQALISRGGFDALRRSTGGVSIDVTLPAEAADGKFHALRRMMHAFVDGCLRGKLNPGAASFEDGLAVQHMIASAEEAARTRDWVTLSPSLARRAAE